VFITVLLIAPSILGDLDYAVGWFEPMLMPLIILFDSIE
jgi:hypothetical protein